MQKLTKKHKTNDLKMILNKVCQLSEFSYGEIWLCDRENDFLELSSDYYIASDRHQFDLELFHACSNGFIMSPGEGLPGRVLQSQKPEWLLDVSVESEDSFLRNKIAGICGVKTGFAIPVMEENKVSMIMAFFSCDLRPYSSNCLALAIDLAIKLSASTGFNENKIIQLS